jgi:hypothetical protein
MMFYSAAADYRPFSGTDLNGSYQLLIFSPDVNDKRYQHQLLKLTRDPMGMDERGVEILEIFPSAGIEADGSAMEEENVNKLRIEFSVPEEKFAVIVINQERKVLYNRPEILEITGLFKLIDADSGK